MYQRYGNYRKILSPQNYFQTNSRSFFPIRLQSIGAILGQFI